MNTVKSLKRCIIGSSEEAERKMRLKNNWKDYSYGIFEAKEIKPQIQVALGNLEEINTKKAIEELLEDY